ncbi:MAG: phospholipid/cholesterol/gamma-HCH transport system permease protein [Thermoleophilaceae bacterium]|jgi:phospholipid/cholesterol/gamma-HCH transport system permease protein|nr:phospholipid/cholesterol/gamma-HCH transport system permease protein [Thermoleophilaceae bacterium]
MIYPRLVIFGNAAGFMWRIGRGLGQGVRVYFGEALRQAGILVTGSSLVVLGLVLALGLVVGIEGSYGARLVGAPAAAGAFTAIADLREIVPYSFAYMMAAKVSTGYVAELGTMRISEEIDALDVMGMDSVAYLCSTRILATWLILPFLYAIAIVVSFAGSFVAVVLQVGQVSAGGYLELFWKFQSPSDWIFSGTKGMLMGTFVVLVGCYYGFSVRGGPVGVGRATAQAMVANLIGIHIIGILTSQVFWGGSARLPIGG